MKKNLYGNIEDMLVNVKVVTPMGTYTKISDWPRVSSGPDLNHMMLGSEGNIGVVTEVTIRVRPMPECRRFGSIVFPDYESGVNFMYEVARSRIWPASMRLVDNTQFKLGGSLKPQSTSFFEDYME